VNRRSFIQTTSGAIAYLSCSPLLYAKGENDLGEELKASLQLTAAPAAFPLLAGNATNMLSFAGATLSGDPEVLHSTPGYLGPRFDVRTGDKIRIQFQNNLAEKCIVHWHGLHLPEPQDGHPSYAIEPGKTYTYNLEIENRAGLYWYHPHPHGRTGYQVYHGLAGLFVVRDDEEDALNLPADENELFFVIQDRELDADNQLVYVKSRHDRMMGKIGDRILVNGQLERQANVKQESYRLRLLNGSNAYPHRLQWSDGRPLSLIGNDGGLLEELTELDSVLFTPGERLDLLVDFSDRNIGDEVELMSIPIVENGRSEPFALYKFTVTEKGVKKYTWPRQLSKIEKIDESEAVNAGNPKVFKLFPKGGIGWTIDGLNYEMNNVRPKERVKLGTTEVWEFDLTSAGMVHPIHVHGSQFQVLERIPGNFSKGLVFDGGWKDTVALLPGDRVRIIKRFHDHPGRFLFHCHNLEHEDHSMMRDFLVEK
jgi:blue copper oxidase